MEGLEGEMTRSKKLSSGLTACIGVAGVLTGAVAGALVAYRRRIRSSCQEFYQNAKRQMVLPGLKDGFDPQDLFYVASANTWLFSGYNVKRDNKDISPVYKVGADGKVSRLVIELPDGSIYRGHGAAICTTDEHAFLTVSDGYVVMHLADLLEATDGETVHAFAHVPVELEPAFMNIQNGILYIGEFYHKHFYKTPRSHWLKCPDGTKNPALMYAYDPSDASDAVFGFTPQPSRVYSIPGEIQGMCVASDNRIVMSKSWGYGDSEMPVFAAGSAVEKDAAGAKAPMYRVAGKKVPLYYLYADTIEKTIALPPMSEGIDYVEGEVWIANESASSLYVLGRINGGKYVYSLSV